LFIGCGAKLGKRKNELQCRFSGRGFAQPFAGQGSQNVAIENRLIFEHVAAHNLLRLKRSLARASRKPKRGKALMMTPVSCDKCFIAVGVDKSSAVA
jgi:hypothetical protein